MTAAEYRYPKNGAVKLMIVENNTIYMAIKLKATTGVQPGGNFIEILLKTGPMPHIVTWSPSLEGFDFFSMMQSIISNKNVNTHVVVLTHSFTKLTNTLNDIGIIKQQVLLTVDISESSGRQRIHDNARWSSRYHSHVDCLWK